MAEIAINQNKTKSKKTHANQAEILGPKNIYQKNLPPRNFWFKNILCRKKNVGPKKHWSRKNLVKIFWVQKRLRVRKQFGCKQISGSKKYLGPKKFIPKDFGSIILVEIGYVTAKILLAWTVIRTKFRQRWFSKS